MYKGLLLGLPEGKLKLQVNVAQSTVFILQVCLVHLDHTT